MSPKIFIDDKEVEIIEDVDENDIEELLKSKISRKNILKIVILIIFVVVVVYFSVSGVFPSDLYIYVIILLWEV